jgi:hypothetical protein
MGGQPAGAIDQSGHDKTPWEKRVDALMRLLSDEQRQLLTVDELRRGIEELGADAYERYSYYERWLASMTNILLEKGVIDVSELGERMTRIENDQNQRL